MKIPEYIEFHSKTKNILSNFLQAAAPEESCAILIGTKEPPTNNKQKHFWRIKYVWQSRNIWSSLDSRLFEPILNNCPKQKKKFLSKEYHFEIDAKDHIAAQKWSRKNNLEILCFAHSHPTGTNSPSSIDLFWHQCPGLMIISDKDGNLKAWWIEDKNNFHQVKIESSSLT